MNAQNNRLLVIAALTQKNLYIYIFLYIYKYILYNIYLYYKYIIL